MENYVIGLTALPMIGLLYPLFRFEVFEDLESRGIRTRDIRHLLKGGYNFWFYREIEAAYGLGLYGKPVRLFIPVYVAVAVLHLSLGWVNALRLADIVLVACLCLFTSVLILFTRFRCNRRAVGSAFVLFGWKKTLNRKGKLLHTDYYSTVADLFFTVAPMVFPYVMMIE